MKISKMIVGTIVMFDGLGLDFINKTFTINIVEIVAGIYILFLLKTNPHD